MSAQNAHPKWWQVYLVFPLLIALFALDSRLKLSVRGHQVVQVGIILLVYGLIHLWISANAKAIRNTDWANYDGKVKVITISSYHSLGDEIKHDEQTILQLPASEIKGALSDTFEMDSISLPDKHTEVLEKEQK
ncbi:MAG TPA: hypothetical protein VMT73_12905 [Anaerolineales bacterium]|nr:hypothetical protein [Anaerolineales bacterium]